MHLSIYDRSVSTYYFALEPRKEKGEKERNKRCKVHMKIDLDSCLNFDC